MKELGNVTKNQEARWALMQEDILAAGRRKKASVLASLEGSMSVPAALKIASEESDALMRDMTARASERLSQTQE